jgi:hypothetical protein
MRNQLFVLLFAMFPAAAQVHFVPDKIAIDIDGKPFTEFHYGTDVGKPFLAPLRAASGTIVTRRYPMEKIAGESTDHLHHRGLWFTYDDVNGIKFWENDPSYTNPNIGHVVARGAQWADQGKDGTLTLDFDWKGPQGKVLLAEHRIMTFYSNPTLRIIDFDITLTAPEKVVFGDTKEGAFAIRLADALTEKKGGRMTNAEGKSGMAEVWGHRSKWVDYSGTIDGEKLGVAIFDSPANPRYPTYWHARDYGLFALNPFGQKAFDKNAPESHWTLDAGRQLRFLWRVVIHPGDTAGANIAELYDEFARGAR